MGLQSGDVLANTYRVVKRIGEGGMGAVYEAAHVRLPGRFAIKVLQADLAGREDALARFKREAEVTSSLRHPNIVAVTDFNVTPDGSPYLVMEFLEGIEVGRLLRQRGRFPVDVVLEIVGQVASALAAAHQHNVVHRDLKPENLFLVDIAGEERPIAKVVDFGISKVRAATTALTQTATIMGTPHYMSPEQAEGRNDEIDGATDQFALAAITYELITGAKAFAGESFPTILYNVVHKPHIPMRTHLPELAPAVEAVVARGLAKKKQDRFPSVRDFHRALVRAVKDGVAPDNAPSSVKDVPQTLLLDEGQPRAEPERSPTTLRPVPSNFPVKSRSRTPMLAMVGIAVAGVAGWALYGRRSLPETAPVTALESPVRSVVAPAAEAKPADPLPNTQPATAVVRVENAPENLQVTLDGRLVDVPVELPYGAALHKLVFSAPGYEPWSVELDGNRSRDLFLDMRRKRAPVTRAGERRPVERLPSTASTLPPTPPPPPATPSPAPPPPPSPPSRKSKLIMDL